MLILYDHNKLPHTVLLNNIQWFESFTSNFLCCILTVFSVWIALVCIASRLYSAFPVFDVHSGHRNMPRRKQQTAAPCPLWWCVLPRWRATGWTKWANSAPKNTSTHCTTPGLLQSGWGKAWAHFLLCRECPVDVTLFKMSILYSLFLMYTLVVCRQTHIELLEHSFSRLQHQVKKHNLIIASYDVVRNDIDFFRWVFIILLKGLCVLDERSVINMNSFFKKYQIQLLYPRWGSCHQERQDEAFQSHQAVGCQLPSHPVGNANSGEVARIRLLLYPSPVVLVRACSHLSLPSEQCPGALVTVRLPHAGLPRNRASVCSSLRETHPGQSRRQKLLAGTGGRYVHIAVVVLWHF